MTSSVLPGGVVAAGAAAILNVGSQTLQFNSICRRRLSLRQLHSRSSVVAQLHVQVVAAQLHVQVADAQLLLLQVFLRLSIQHNSDASSLKFLLSRIMCLMSGTLLFGGTFSPSSSQTFTRSAFLPFAKMPLRKSSVLNEALVIISF
ncbi:hypothetical protein TNCT_16751 [Trichonephila clavata]|uniref:Uncharacterized protein n=1 Tax=Trichonephila clavata TaxID=2740835 RepID=A0A8X6L1W3_TRICU|nr:hypothetical protein TNCT_16751 [Trichonephila clavata]